jgi:alkylation response protein AidB-like acyl-CoA dehydrogenase
MLRPAPAEPSVVAVAEHVAALPSEEVYAAAAWEACARVGLTSLPISPSWGGAGCSLRETAMLFEAFAAAGAPPGLVFALGAQLWSVTSVLARFGTDEQLDRWLRPLCAGRLRGAHAMTEPMAGSDAFSLVTSALVGGGGVAISGSKTLVTNGTEADLFLVFATSDRSLGWAGVGCYLVAADTPGLAVRRLPTVAVSAPPLAELELAGCEVHATDRLSTGSGAVVFNHAMDLERSLLAAGMIGVAWHRLATSEAAGAVDRDRRSALLIRLAVARSLVRQAAARLDAGRRAPRESSLAKLAASELWWSAADHVSTSSGPAAMLDEAGDLADAAAARIYSGTSQLQREMLGRSLGL